MSRSNSRRVSVSQSVSAPATGTSPLSARAAPRRVVNIVLYRCDSLVNSFSRREMLLMSVSRIARRVSVCAGFVGLAAVALSGCGGGGGSSPIVVGPGPGGNFTAPGTTPFVNSNNASRGACAVNAHQNGRARWTVLVYHERGQQPAARQPVQHRADGLGRLQCRPEYRACNGNKPRRAPGTSSVTPETTPSFIGTRRYKLSKHSQADLNKIAPPGIETNELPRG